MTPTLEKLRDELANEHADKDFDASDLASDESQADYVCCKEDFKAGFDAALKALTESAGEFSEKDVEKKWMEIWHEQQLNDEDFITPGYTAYEEGILALVRWQHSQDAARIGLAEQDVLEAADIVNRLKARVKELEGENLDAVAGVVSEHLSYKQACKERDEANVAAARIFSDAGRLTEERDRYRIALDVVLGEATNIEQAHAIVREAFIDGLSTK